MLAVSTTLLGNINCAWTDVTCRAPRSKDVRQLEQCRGKFPVVQPVSRTPTASGLWLVARTCQTCTWEQAVIRLRDAEPTHKRWSRPRQVSFLHHNSTLPTDRCLPLWRIEINKYRPVKHRSSFVRKSSWTDPMVIIEVMTQPDVFPRSSSTA